LDQRQAKNRDQGGQKKEGVMIVVVDGRKSQGRLPYMNTAVVLLGTITTARGRGQHGHMGRNHGDVRDDQKESSSKLHFVVALVVEEGEGFLFVEWVRVVMRSLKGCCMLVSVKDI
jgi:hypothetical protein